MKRQGFLFDSVATSKDKVTLYFKVRDDESNWKTVRLVVVKCPRVFFVLKPDGSDIDDTTTISNSITVNDANGKVMERCKTVDGNLCVANLFAGGVLKAISVFKFDLVYGYPVIGFGDLIIHQMTKDGVETLFTFDSLKLGGWYELPPTNVCEYEIIRHLKPILNNDELPAIKVCVILENKQSLHQLYIGKCFDFSENDNVNADSPGSTCDMIVACGNPSKCVIQKIKHENRDKYGIHDPILLDLAWHPSFSETYFDMDKSVSSLLLYPSLAWDMSLVMNCTLREFCQSTRSQIIEHSMRCKLISKRIVILHKMLKSPVEGGLVLDPVKGVHRENLMFLFDFMSLYPSTIREFNICILPGPEYILPEMVGVLVDWRKNLSGSVSSKNPIIQKRKLLSCKELKLFANSIYGCVCSTRFEYYNPVTANLITAKGRELLEGLHTSLKKMGLEVLFGDTDSILVKSNLTKLSQKEEISAFVDLITSKHSHGHIVLELDEIVTGVVITRKKEIAYTTLQNENEVVMKSTMGPSNPLIFREYAKNLFISALKSQGDFLPQLPGAFIQSKLSHTTLRDWEFKRVFHKKLSEYAYPCPISRTAMKYGEIQFSNYLFSHVYCAEQRLDAGDDDAIVHIFSTDDAINRNFHPCPNIYEQRLVNGIKDVLLVVSENNPVVVQYLQNFTVCTSGSNLARPAKKKRMVTPHTMGVVTCSNCHAVVPFSDQTWVDGIQFGIDFNCIPNLWCKSCGYQIGTAEGLFESIVLKFLTDESIIDLPLKSKLNITSNIFPHPPANASVYHVDFCRHMRKLISNWTEKLYQ